MRIDKQPTRPPATPKTLGQKVMAEWADNQKDEIASGQTLVVQMEDGTEYRVEGGLIGPASKRVSAFSQFVQASASEIAGAVKAGPNLSLLAATEVVKPLVLGHAPPEVASLVNQYYEPALMGASLSLSMHSFNTRYKAMQTRDVLGVRDTSLQTLGLWANGAHVLTSAVGFGGAVGAALIPSLASWAAPTWGVAVAGNVLSFGINWMEYISQRSSSDNPLGDNQPPRN